MTSVSLESPDNDHICFNFRSRCFPLQFLSIQAPCVSSSGHAEICGQIIQETHSSGWERHSGTAMPLASHAAKVASTYWLPGAAMMAIRGPLWAAATFNALSVRHAKCLKGAISLPVYPLDGLQTLGCLKALLASVTLCIDTACQHAVSWLGLNFDSAGPVCHHAPPLTVFTSHLPPVDFI